MHFHAFVFEIDHDVNHSNNGSSSRLEVDFGKPQLGNFKVIDKIDPYGFMFIDLDLYSGDSLIKKVGLHPFDSHFNKKKHIEKERVDQVIIATSDVGKKIIE